MNTKFSKGDRIISIGEKADKAFLIKSGEARVFLEKKGKNVTLAELKQGDIFGESALFDDQFIYGANVEASEDIELGIITPEEFRYEVETCNPMLRTIIRMLIERLRHTNQDLLDSETREFMDIDLVEGK